MLARSLFPVLMRVCRGLSVCVSYFVQLKGEVGTPMWMAPEVLMNESFTFKADVYSFGVVCWELLTGKVPWKGMLPAQIICGVAFNGMRLSIPEEIDGRLASLMCDCWHEEPAQRPSFDEIKDRLKPLLQQAEKVEREGRLGAAMQTSAAMPSGTSA